VLHIVLLFVSVVSTPMTTVHSVHGWCASFVSLLISSQIVFMAKIQYVGKCLLYH